MTTLDISGTFVLNKKQSDDTDEILRLQGVSWLTRKIIGMATITCYIKHYKDDDGVEHIDITQVATPGSVTNTELRTLNWQGNESKDPVFGNIVGKSRRIQVGEIEGDEWLKEGWFSDTTEHGAIQAFAESDTPKSGTSWSADAIWGFAEIDGERKYTRRVYFVGPGKEDIKARMVYDYSGPNVRAN